MSPEKMLRGLRSVFPNGDERWMRELVKQAPAYGIDTPHELASISSQFGHETRGFTRFEENLNYSASRLTAVWPRRYPDLHTALLYAHNPELLANKVYNGRMGNDQPGDGWKYRGRGPQLTGKNNYRKASALIGHDLVAQPDLMLTPEIGVLVACAGWKALGLDWHDDDADASAESFIVNGGNIGLRERQDLLDALLRVLA